MPCASFERLDQGTYPEPICYLSFRRKPESIFILILERFVM
jgi:hypothetical protein